MKTPTQIDLVREAFHYQSRFAGSTMVFKIEYPVTGDPGFPSLMKDLSLLAHTGFKVLIVPGARESINAVLSEYGVVTGEVPPGQTAGSGRTPAFTLRRTPNTAMPLVEMAAFHVATRFMTALSGYRTDSVIGNFVRSRGLGVLDGQDMESTGRVEKILDGPITRVLDLGIVPILPCIGWGTTGKSYNLSSDEIALAASQALNALKLFIISAETRPASGGSMQLTPREAEAALETSSGRAREELELALAASRAGIPRIHIVDGREDGVVLRELFSNIGSGTMVYADEYAAVRPLKTADVPDILRIMEPLMQQGTLVRRTAEDILAKKDDYYVAGVDGRAHACGALHSWGGQGEIAAVAVDSAYADMGLGRLIVGFLINRARSLNLRRVFVLTIRTQEWFESLGFREAGPEALPEERRKTYNKRRNSKVFALELFEEEPQ